MLAVVEMRARFIQTGNISTSTTSLLKPYTTPSRVVYSASQPMCQIAVLLKAEVTSVPAYTPVSRRVISMSPW